jgi:prophage regulatory protein
MQIQQLYRINQVCEITGIRPSTIYKLIREGKFPPPLKINTTSAWTSSSIGQWMDSLNNMEQI